MNTFEEKWKNNKDLAFGETLRRSSKVQNWILNRNGFSNLDEFKQFIRCKERILDAGCGNGRVTALMATHNPNATIIGLDMFPEVAKENLEEYRNVFVVRGDIENGLGVKNKFDFIYCQEVLHHLKNPKQGFFNLCELLQKNGEIAIYVYKKKAPAREFVDEYIRGRIHNDDYNTAMKKVEGFTQMGKELQKIKKKVKISSIEEMEIPEGEYTVHELVYNFFCKCYYNEELGMEGSNAINFDWYHPLVSSKHTSVEVEGWFGEAGLDILHKYTDNYGITIWGIKK